MDVELSEEGIKPVPQSDIRTSDVYRVNSNLPKRFNHPESFNGYSKKTVHPLYQTTNQTYGSKKPTVHEMPTTFHGSCRRFSEELLKSGMFRDKGFNTTVEKSRITDPSSLTTFYNKISFHQSYHANTPDQTEYKMA